MNTNAFVTIIPFTG